MDLNTLASNLRAQAAANSKIVLDASVFSDEVRTAIRSAFAFPAEEDLTISEVHESNISDPSDGVLTISAGKASVLKREVHTTLTFTSAGDELEAIIVFDMGEAWNFKDSFDGLDTFPFTELKPTNARFVYTTVARSEYAWPGEPSSKIELAAGLNFLSHITFKHFPTIRNLLKSVVGDWSLALKFYGPFAREDGQDLPVGKLRAPLGTKTFKIGTSPIELSLGAPAIAVEIGTADEDDPLQPVELLVEAEFQEVLNVGVATPVTGGSFELMATPRSGVSFDDVITKLPGVGNVRSYIPAELSQIFAEVGFDDFSLIVAPDMKVTFVGLSISTSKPWNVIPDVLLLEDLSLKVATIEPADLNWTRVHIAATSKFLDKTFKGEFAFTVELEKLNSWEVMTVSGEYHGSVNLKDLVAGILRSDASLPSVLKGIDFSNFGVSATRETKGAPFTYSLYGSCEAGFPILDKQFTSALSVAVTTSKAGSRIKLGGGLVIGEQVFSLELNLGDAKAKLEATWENQGTPFGFGDIARAFGWDDMPPMPEGLDLALKEARFTYDFTAKTVVLTAKSANYGQIIFASLKKKGSDNRVYFFALDVSLDLKFSEFPLVGESLPTDKPVGVEKLQIIVASEELKQEQVTDLNTLIGGTPLMLKSLGKGLTLAAKLELNGPHEIVLPLTGGAKKQVEVLLLLEATTDETAPAEALAAPTYQAEAKWFNLQKTLGPVHFDKVGVQYQGATIRFLLNAALSAAGLTLSVDGLSVGSSLKQFKPEFELRGLGVDYKAGDIEIGGAFLKSANGSYDGAAVIKTKQVVLSALGSYTKVNDEPSLFIYAFLDYPLGGPTFFFVTGLAAGFGYNRRLIAPAIDDVAKFPLITQANGGRKPKDVMDALTTLHTHIPPASGSIFLAVGVKFNSFKLIDSFALLTVEFGNNFTINLLGLSTAIVPTPEAGKTFTPLAQVQIAWKATFNPDDGCLGIDARLTPNSYILSKDCRLSGGYAFYSWFSGKNAGDFVQTLGGYHSKFTIPPHYPKVPRLAFDWRVSNSLTIQGNAFYALTGSALMAGGYLEVLFREGELRAWLKVGAEFLIAWKPYHYDALLSISVGASYTFDINLLFTHVRVTISIDVGAQLHLWGPDFSGTARIDLSVISFTIAFGAGASQSPAPIKEWSTFQQSFLPAKNVCSISVKDGLVRNIEKPGEERWVINPKQFALVVDSAVPFKSAPSGSENLVKDANVKFGVGPMAVNAGRLASTLSLSIKKNGKDVDREFKYSLIKKQVPLGLWSETAEPELKHGSFIKDVPAGIEITPGKHPEPGETAKVDRKVFDYSSAYYPKGGIDPEGDAFKWEAPSSFVPSPDVKDAQARRKAIRDTVASNERRADLLEQLGLTFDINIRESVAGDFLSAPHIGTL